MSSYRSVAIVRSRALQGIHSPEVLVETHLSSGLPKFNIVGLPETAVRESRDRVRAAIENSHFKFPLLRVTVSLAPADLPKAGGRYDLPIAIGILCASGQIPRHDPDTLEIIGELGLDGRVRSVSGALVTATQSAAVKRPLVLPAACLQEASMAPDAALVPVSSLPELVQKIKQRPLEYEVSGTPNLEDRMHTDLDLSQVRGQPRARRALEIAAAGRLNLIFVGPPGTGKTMLARRLPSILPTMSQNEALETAALHSVSRHGVHTADFGVRPFRSPHHSASGASLIGGGSRPQPGEVSLAHNGVLFLDEMPEFERRVLDMLREPLETGEVHIARALQHVTFPASFQLIGALNPCPCGYAGDKSRVCQCSPEVVSRYQHRLTGPLLDRIDLHVEVPAVPARTLYQCEAENSETIAARVAVAWKRRQIESGASARELSGVSLQTACKLKTQVRDYLVDALESFGLSLRVHDRVLRVARTIADLEQVEAVAEPHLAEALSLRLLDRRHSVSR